MKFKFTFRHTIYASYLGYITQSIGINLSPLLFVVFRQQFHISFERIGLLISVNFVAQMLTDLISARFIDKHEYRPPVVAAHVLSALGLLSMGILPFYIDPYTALMISTVLTAVGGGLVEVLVSPIVESCPGEEKAAAMSLLHSFYSWGQVAVVLLSTLFFVLFGEKYWFILPMLWALVPAVNVFLFSKVPIRKLVDESQRVPLRKLFSVNMFWVLLLLMIGAGAAEQAMAQWASLFAEVGLGVSKTLGDLLGPCAFAALMGAARLFYGIKGSKVNLTNMLSVSAVLCVISYLVTVFSKNPVLSLVGCAMCGLAVGIMWPGSISLATRCYPQGGAAMFAVLALAGDMGCSAGPGIVGVISSAVENGAMPILQQIIPSRDPTEAGLKTGLLLAIIFPVLVLIGVYWLRALRDKQSI